MSDAKPGAPGAPEPGTKPVNPALLPKQEMTFSQHLFIWTMVVLVGVVFGGVGSGLPMFISGMQNAKDKDGVDRLDIMRLQTLTEALQSAINPSYNPMYARFGMDPGPYFLIGSEEAARRHILSARRAFTDGFEPSSKVMDGVVKEFLNRKLPRQPFAQPDGQEQRTYLAALNERSRGKKAVSESDLRWYLAMEQALLAQQFRAITPPVISHAVAQEMRGLSPADRSPGDRVKVDQLILSAKAFMEEVKDEDPEIAAAYTTLRTGSLAKKARFAEPATAMVTAVYVDLKVAFDKIESTPVPIERVKATYEKNKQKYRKTDAQAVNLKDDAAYKPLDDTLRAEIEKELKAQDRLEAVTKARKMLVDFEDACSEQGLAEKDLAAFKAAADKVGLSVKDGIEVKDDGGKKMELPGLGEITEGERRAQFFLRNEKTLVNQKGYIAPAMQLDSDKNEGTWVVLRIAEHREARTRDLSDPDVKRQVKEYIAGRRAWKKLLAEANTLREDAEKAGPGGLRKRFDDPEVKKKWGLKVETKTDAKADGKTDAKPEAKPEPKADPTANLRIDSTELDALHPVRPPRDDIDATPADSQPVASLALPTWPVFLATGTSDGDVPSVRLIQATAYIVPPPAPKEETERYLHQYRDGIMREQFRQFQNALKSKAP